MPLSIIRDQRTDRISSACGKVQRSRIRVLVYEMRLKTNRKSAHRPSFLLLLAVISFVLLAGAESVGARRLKPRLTEMVAANSKRDLIIFGRVENAFTPEMEKGIKNGIPATFTFEVKLVREVRDWPDRELINIAFDHQLAYDNLKDEYRITLGEEGGREVTTSSFDRAREIMTTINGVRVMGLSGLKAGETYALWAQVRLERATLPLYFHYLIPFWGVWDLKTDWSHVKFRY